MCWLDCPEQVWREIVETEATHLPCTVWWVCTVEPKTSHSCCVLFYSCNTCMNDNRMVTGRVAQHTCTVMYHGMICIRMWECWGTETLVLTRCTAELSNGFCHFFCVSVLCMGCIGTDQLERHLSQINLCTRWSPKHLWSLHFQYYYTSPLPNLSFSVDITTSSSSSRFPTINIIRCLNGHWDNIWTTPAQHIAGVWVGLQLCQEH